MVCDNRCYLLLALRVGRDVLYLLFAADAPCDFGFLRRSVIEPRVQRSVHGVYNLTNCVEDRTDGSASDCADLGVFQLSHSD